jgi:hypothetical protein
MQGGEHGTRNFALAARRADPGDYSVVVVLRPLTVETSGLFRLRHRLAEPVFLRQTASNFLKAGALFHPNSAMTPEEAVQAGAKHRDGYQ